MIYVLRQHKRGHKIHKSHEDEHESRATDVKLKNRVRFTQEWNLPTPLAKCQEEWINVFPIAPLSRKKKFNFETFTHSFEYLSIEM